MQLRDCPHECETAANITEVGLRSCEDRLVKTIKRKLELTVS